jgi:hypothetical protein
MIPTWPTNMENQEATWVPGAGVHLDNYGPHGWTGGFNCGFGLVALLNDVVEREGCFTYWRGSHHSTHQFFSRYPEQIDGSFTARPEWEDFWGQVSTPQGRSPSAASVPSRSSLGSAWAVWTPVLFFFLQGVPRWPRRPDR